jgi:hypothetical protein
MLKLRPHHREGVAQATLWSARFRGRANQNHCIKRFFVDFHSRFGIRSDGWILTLLDDFLIVQFEPPKIVPVVDHEVMKAARQFEPSERVYSRALVLSP